MKSVRTAVVALSLLVVGTVTIQAEPSGVNPSGHATPQAPPVSTPEQFATPTPSPAAPRATATENPADLLRRAIEQAAAFLGPKELDADEAWIATQGALLLGPGFKAWARTLSVSPYVADAANPSHAKNYQPWMQAAGHLWSLRTTPPRKIDALPTPAAGAEPGRSEQSDTGDPVEIAFLSVRCQNLHKYFRDRWLSLLSENRHDYVLTAQLFGLMISYNQGCLSPRVANPIRRQLATRTFRELRADSGPLDDLDIQRIAALCYAGACGWIDPELIARVVAAQKPSGSWGTPVHGVEGGVVVATQDRTAAYAFYALARWWSHRYASERGPRPPGK